MSAFTEKKDRVLADVARYRLIENTWQLADGKIAWVIGFRPDERFKVTENTERVLLVKRM